MRTRILLTVLSLFFSTIIYAQIEESVVEKIEEEDADAEIIDALEDLKKHPLDLNQVTEAELKMFRIINEMQIHHFLVYRKTVGAFIDVHELQSIPLWDPQIISQLLPYVRIGSGSLVSSLIERSEKGDHSFLLRASRTIETPLGYKIENGYSGNRDKLLLKYKYRFKNLLQYGMTAEKDPGEKMRPDLLSFHVFIRNAGRVRAIAIGDFSVNLGQGLIQYHSMSAGKTSEVMYIKQQAEQLRPYASSSEYNFNRGIGITIGKKKWESTLYFSLLKLSTSIGHDPNTGQETITSISSTGLHRTNAEIERRKNNTLMSAGMGVRYRSLPLQFGLNAVVHRLSMPLMKNEAPYNYYDPAGSAQKNLSTDVSYTYGNAHGFAEFAVNADGGTAFLGGLMASLHRKMDVSVLFRKVSPDYHALQARAFLESGAVTNEAGIYSGISIRPHQGITIQAYADVFSHKFPRFRKSAPSHGSDWFIQAAYQPNKKTSVYLRYLHQLQDQDEDADDQGIRTLTEIHTRKWRLHYIYNVSSSIRFQARTEVLRWKKGEIYENGFVGYLDMTSKARKRFSATLRILAFETSAFNSRIYAYEPDVPYSASVPFFYGEGHRYILIGKFDLTRHLDLSVKWAQTIYDNRKSIGSGLDEIPGDVRSDLRFQLLCTF